MGNGRAEIPPMIGKQNTGEMMKTQLEYIKKVLSLAESNPQAEIKLCVDGDTVLEYGWTAHEIKRVELSCWIEFDERIYTDEDLAKDEIMDMFFNDDIPLDELGKRVDDYFEKHVIDAICIFTYSP